MNLKYLLGAIISAPLLPILYFQGRKIRASVPQLPEASGIEGEIIFKTGSTKSLTMLTIGESTIAGVGVHTHQEGFTGTLANELSILFETNVKWKVYARSGYTAKQVSDKIISNISESHADLLVIGLGGNDAFTLNSPKRWRKHIEELVQTIREKFPNSAIVFCNMPPIKAFPAFTPLIKFVIGNLVEILGDELDMKIQGHKNVFYFNERITIADWINRLGIKVEKADFFSDGVHPSKLTYQTWALDVARKISSKEILKKKY